MATVNWDPVDQTVLANEQVIDGAAGARAPWSSGARSRNGLFDYRLCGRIVGGPRHAGRLARGRAHHAANWIGKSRGVELAFGLDEPVANLDRIEVYTTGPTRSTV